MYQLIATWTVLPGKKDEAITALKALADEVKAKEPDTLIYLPHSIDFDQTNLPLPSDGVIVFFEVYKDKDAFMKHITGESFTNFVKQYGKLFLSDSNGNNFVQVQTLLSVNGFIRPEALSLFPS